MLKHEHVEIATNFEGVTLHCKYLDGTQYSFLQCYVCHSSMAVLNTVNGSAQSIAVLNLKCS